ncbi:MAG: energy-coupling factor ABC transporter permease [Thermoleophilia bacterium]
MHIPDGFLDGGVAAGAGAVAAVVVAVGLRRASTTLDERRVPLLGVTGAFVFAAQMLNFPVAGGTSGHFLGAGLAAILLGPWVGSVVMAVVIALQAFVFADGGITALGANVLNMGVIGALVVGLLMGSAFRVLPRTRTALLAVTAAGTWLAVMLGATATAIELGASGTVPLGTVLPAMLGVHALIGIGEAVVTVAAVGAVLATRPDLLAVKGFARIAPAAPVAPATAPVLVQEARP